MMADLQDPAKEQLGVQYWEVGNCRRHLQSTQQKLCLFWEVEVLNA